ncbi:hypothetical protein DUI87_08593 [Hirundo rustica rustica]|uniref:ribonuclease H n=1 Tax=Hirundo rustica rustica TaxID=333673 RepID=A0A3M0L2J5_HIRRU|nr:hypothetical protein DUI87_08593 [Hirundo rustica rustica]
MEARSLPPPERSPSSPAVPGCVSAAELSDRSPAAGAGSSTAEDAAGPAPAAGLTPPLLPTASVAAATGAEVFKFSTNGDTAGMRPVFDTSKSSRAVGSSSTAWMLPPCQVTVCLKDHGLFWGEVKAKIEGLNDGADAGTGPAVSDVQPVPSRVPASDPVGSTGQNTAGAAASSEGLQAFPVLQGATHNTYQPLAWQALTELRDAVGKYGLGSGEVMQVLRYFNASLLTPFDIRSLARALFPPVEYDFFENKWTQLAGRTVEWNRTLGQGDPRRMVNIDMLMGTGNYSRVEGQDGYEPLVQEQCQQTDMAALVQTLQLATPQQPFATIVQGVDEPFLCFAGWLTAAVEEQVSDPAARKLTIQSLAQGNCNAVCTRIIEALPGEPSVLDMVGACAKDRPLGENHMSRINSDATCAGMSDVGLLNVRCEKMWVEQWPLSKEKLKALEELVEEQLAKGHIVETNSPWNSPVFVIKKPGKDKWRLLHDLRQINNVIEDMGSLQPGMPSLTMLPENWNLAVIDIKDCFFQIPLHPDDAPRFAFSVPTINRVAPRRRYHWRVLPQGMKNSPVICQPYVASLLSPVRAAADKAIIYHYMDDVLVCAPSDDDLSHALDLTINSLIAAGFELQNEKVQRMPPWRYLGLEISKRTIVPQKLEIKTKVSTLADLHQLCGSLNWVRPWLGLSTEDLAPLFNLLKGGEELSSPRVLTPEAEIALERVQECMSKRQAHRCDPGLPFKFIVMGRLPHLHGVIFQWRETPKKDRGKEDPLLIIEWVFLSHQRSKRMTRPQELVAELIRKARSRIRDLAGCDFECIHVPIGLQSGQITKAMLEHLIQENESLQFALDSFTGQISIHRPAHKIFNQDNKFVLSLKNVQSRKPLKALTVFTDASGRSHKSVLTWKDQQTQRWEADVEEVEGSPQIAELAAVVRAFERFSEPFNLVTDSAYVAGVVSRAEQSILQEVPNIALFNLLSKLAFSFLGIPRELKTDNGPAYRSREFRDFLQQWGMEHKTGIPHSPTGQAMVERTHQNIKRVLHQHHQVLKTEPPSTRLARALFTINFLNCSFEGLNPPVVRHFGASPQFHANEKPPVMVKDPETGKTDGPHGLVTWGRGYACVSTPTGPKWIPSKWVRPYVPKVSGTHGKKSVQVTEAAWRRRRRETEGLEELPFSSDLPILD